MAAGELSRPASIAPGRRHRPNAGRPGVIPRGEKLGTLEDKPFSVYDENTARIQTGRQFYIYLPTRPIDTSLPTRNARAPREQLSARHLASRCRRFAAGIRHPDSRAREESRGTKPKTAMARHHADQARLFLGPALRQGKGDVSATRAKTSLATMAAVAILASVAAGNVAFRGE